MSKTQCNQKTFAFHPLDGREIVAGFDGGTITSDGATMRANQLRLWLSSVAYTLMSALRRLGLKGTALAKAQCDTIRVKLLKIGAHLRVTVRKVWVSFTESCPYQSLFRKVCDYLCRQLRFPLRC